MNSQSRNMVVNELIKVVNLAPTLYSQINYYQPNMHPRSDISLPEFSNWVYYANQTLLISYNYTGLAIIPPVKMRVDQISNQQGIPYLQRVDQIKWELLNLAQLINQY